MENGSAKSLGGISSMGPSMDFRNADVAARRRIEELEALAAARLKEVSVIVYEPVGTSALSYTALESRA